MGTPTTNFNLARPDEGDSDWTTEINGNWETIDTNLGAHAGRHRSGGADAIKLDDLSAPDDNTDLDASTAKHGLCPKAPDDVSKFMRGDASWAHALSAARKFFAVNSAAATFQAMGVAAPTTSGTLANSNDDSSTWTRATSAASSGSTGGIISATFNLVRRAHDPQFYARVRTDSAVDNARIWVGLCSAAPGNSDSPAISLIAFRYSAGVGGNWYRCTKDGSTLNAVDTGVACGASTDFKLEIVVDSAAGTAEFFINGTSVGTNNANLPGASTDLGYVAYVVATSASGRLLHISRLLVDCA